MVKYGIDVSKWQGDIDWKKVRATSTIDFIIPRLGSKRKLDQSFIDNVTNALCNDIGVPGVYYFMYDMTSEEAIETADWVVDQLQTIEDGLGIRPIVFADYEYTSVRYAAEHGVTINTDDINAIVDAFCGRVQECGYNVGIYCNYDYYTNVYRNKKIFENRKLWLAYLNSPEPPVKCTFHQTSFIGRIDGIKGDVDLDTWYCEEESVKMEVTANDVLDVARNWLGRNEADGSHKEIIDIYNSYKPLARGYKVKYTDSWCDTFVSACFIKLNAVELIGGTECGCEEHIKKFRTAGIWEEDGRIVPKVGDIILFNWDINQQQNNGYADHIGIVEEVNGSSIVTIEGNYKDKVTRRRINVGWGYIRGYARPKYSSINSDPTPVKPEEIDLDRIADEVIRGAWGNGEERVKNLKAAGLDPVAVQKIVNNKLSNYWQLPSIDEIVVEVINGEWGNYPERRERLEVAGYNYEEVQRRVNARLGA